MEPLCLFVNRDCLTRLYREVPWLDRTTEEGYKRSLLSFLLYTLNMLSKCLSLEPSHCKERPMTLPLSLALSR